MNTQEIKRLKYTCTVVSIIFSVISIALGIYVMIMRNIFLGFFALTPGLIALVINIIIIIKYIKQNKSDFKVYIKEISCNDCKNRGSDNCPNSYECYSTTQKPYFIPK